MTSRSRKGQLPFVSHFFCNSPTLENQLTVVARIGAAIELSLPGRDLNSWVTSTTSGVEAA